MFEYIDNYCERLAPGFWAEPVNALSNILIFAAGLVVYLKLNKLGSSKAKNYALVCAAMAMVTGTGSFLFHTFANTLTKWMDVLPITFFQVCSINFYLQFIFKKSFTVRAIFLIGFILVSGFFSGPQFSQYFNGSVGYFPSFATLIVFGFILYFQKLQKIAWYTISASGVFLISLSFRSIDMKVCSSFPLGTHFLWHSLNGLLLYLVLSAISESIRLQKPD